MKNATFATKSAEAALGVVLQEFSGKLLEKWKSFLLGSTPMAGLSIAGLVNPNWISLPLWLWFFLIFVAGLLAAVFHIYSELRQERTELRDLLKLNDSPDQYVLVRICPHMTICTALVCPRKAAANDL